MSGEITNIPALELRLELEYVSSIEEIMIVLDIIQEYVLKKREQESQK